MGPYHNKGQEDGAKGPGNDDPPHGVFSELFSYGESHRQINEDNNDYWDGYNHARSQDD